jgi:hypothetical protein
MSGAQAGKKVSSGVLTEIYNRYAQQRKPVTDQLADLRSKITSISTSFWLSEENDAKVRLNNLIHENQIYRFAAIVYGYDDPTHMTAKELNTFCFVWFGLIAFAVSALGPLLAICYYRIKYPARIGRTAWNDLVRAARRYVIRLARKNKIVKVTEVERIVDRPVEVPVEVVREVVKEVAVPTVVTEVHEVVKEVPVDRIVPVEKLVEVKVKELIYVPIFTNDPDVLKGQLI